MKIHRKLVALTVCAMASGLASGTARAQAEGQGVGARAPADPYTAARERMVQRHLVERGIKDDRVLAAFRKVPRHRFLSADSARLAYEDVSIPIGEGQTITPPYDVAFMTKALAPQPNERILEIGTGSGYQGSILAQLAGEVYSIEIQKPLAEQAAKRFSELGYTNVKSRAGDGFAGWPEAAPFDGIIVTCAPKDIPRPLVDQLKEGGRMVIPLGQRYLQKLYVLEKRGGKMVGRAAGGTLFVPMTGRAQSERGSAPDVKSPVPREAKQP